MSDRVAAALTVAGRLGVPVAEPVVLRDLTSTLVRLAPSPVVARVWDAGARDRLAVTRELEVTAYLAGRGAAVTAPYDDPGPHVAGDQEVTLWHLVDHDPDRPLDAVAAGRTLREIHDLLADGAGPDLTDLPHFARLDETAEIVAGLDVGPDDRRTLAEMLSLAEERVEALDLPHQPLHGDAWLGNVLRAPQGPVWSDFEMVCRGPREVDLTANLAVARLRGGSPDDDLLLDGYGDVDRELVMALLPLAVVPFVAWTFRVAGQRADFLPAARARLDLALTGLTA